MTKFKTRAKHVNNVYKKERVETILNKKQVSDGTSHITKKSQAV